MEILGLLIPKYYVLRHLSDEYNLVIHDHPWSGMDFNTNCVKLMKKQKLRESGIKKSFWKF